MERKNIVIPIAFIEFSKDINSALVLQNLIEEDNFDFFPKLYTTIERETFLSEYQIRRALNKLKELELIETKVMKVDGTPMIHFKINVKRTISLASNS